MKNNKIRGYVLAVVVLVVFCLVAFLPPFRHTGAFWGAFVFGLIAIVAQIYFFRYAFSSGSDAKSRFYGIPIARIGLIYAIVQLIVSVLEMVFAGFLPSWIAILVDAVIAAAALAGGIAADTMREEIRRQDDKLKKDVSAMRELQSLANDIAGQCDDEAVKKELGRLSEEIRYSDPVSSEATAALEAEMLGQLKEIQNALAGGNAEAVKKIVARAMANLTERNRICRLSK